jgi:peptidoglycan/LPS O-acetylase OafA/YrhL
MDSLGGGGRSMGTSGPGTIHAKPRLVGLDLLRLVAVILVLGRHMDLPPEDWARAWRTIFLTWQWGGWVGADLFFVLSGFLVSGLLFAEYEARGRLSIVEEVLLQ